MCADPLSFLAGDVSSSSESEEEGNPQKLEEEPPDPSKLSSPSTLSRL